MISSMDRLRANAALVEADRHEPAEANTPVFASKSCTQRLKVSFEAGQPVEETNKDTEGFFRIDCAFSK
jgi:hypothetical protein